MKQYLDLCQRVLDEGVVRPNRTGVDTIGIQGAMLQFNLAHGFPAVTTKRLYYNKAFAEMLGFFRGYDNAAKFRALGCDVWDQNANENEQWLNNPRRKGTDDLGRIYGVQGRRWTGYDGTEYDQLRMVYNDLKDHKDNRREIVSHWNPAEMKRMALPPCHLLYQFGIQENRLNLTMYQRSADIPLGVPFNIAGYAWLLCVMARITKLVPGVFTHFIHDAHIYVDQIDGIETQLTRTPKPLPRFWMLPQLKTFEDIDHHAKETDFKLANYDHHPGIKFPFAV